jgi:hypothetical protein
MGADIHGWVEVEDDDMFESGNHIVSVWHGVIKIDHLVHRSYGMFGSLFGWRNGYGFRPIVDVRGAPEDQSEEYFVAKQSFEQEGATWISAVELAAVDWNEEGEDYLDETTHTVESEPGPGRRRSRRGDYFNGGWAVLIELIGRLAQEYGPHHVRLLVWFNMA